MGGKKRQRKPQEREYESDTPRFKRGTTHLKMAGHAVEKCGSRGFMCKR